MDLCFELARLIADALDGAVDVADEVHGFRYFDERDILGFVDGTENPEGQGAVDAVFLHPDDVAQEFAEDSVLDSGPDSAEAGPDVAAAAGAAAVPGTGAPGYPGSTYAIVQKYTHDMSAWEELSVEDQEAAFGWHKLSDMEFPDEDKAPNSHLILNTIEDEDGTEHKIVRDNMVFGSVESGEFGTYFIGYAADDGVTEQMLENMFIGNLRGTYDRILDFSTAQTGGLFFVPSQDFLDDPDGELAAAEPSDAQNDDPASASARVEETDPPNPASADDPAPADDSLGIGSLGIGSLRRRDQ